ncbi:GRIP and coiled-coil domain-containing protein 2 [Rhinophrynus dorsalis]
MCEQSASDDQRDTGQDGVSSPATPGSGKSKLDTLPKEDLVRFAKKQLMLIQKVKARCTDLEKEVEELKSKPIAGGADDVVQALTDRLDSVLLEKAEAQQQLSALKKNFAKTKEESEDAAKKASELQKRWEQTSTNLTAETKALREELMQTQATHKDYVDALKRELQEALEKQNALNEKLVLQESQEVQIKSLEEKIQLIRPAYEEQISNLQKALAAIAEEKDKEITRLKDAQVASSQQYHHEIQNLHEELLALRTVHQGEMSDLMQQLESSANEYVKERETMQGFLNQNVEKEKLLIEEMEANSKKHEDEVRLLRERIEEMSKVSEHQCDAPLTPDCKVEHLETALAEFQSQQSILKDELTYTNNMKIKLEMEVQHLKNEYFHEREELEFKVNELQLAIEDYNGLIEKLKSQLQATKEDCERLGKQHSEDVKAMREQHKKEVTEMKQLIASHFESERSSFVHEIKILKEQCDKLQQEKEEAVSSYENLRETLVSLQAELGESAGKISKEFEAMKQQQATDVHELQQKLRAAYKDKNNLLETVNRLQAEVEVLSCKKSECEELELQINNLLRKNEEVMASLHQKDEMLKDLEVKMGETTIQNAEMVSNIQFSSEEIQRLQEMFKSEQARALSLQQESENQTQLNAELKQKLEELMKPLQESINDCDQSHHGLDSLKQQLENVQLEKQNLEVLSNERHNEVLRLIEEKDILSKDFARLTSEHSECLSLRKDLEDVHELQQKLGAAYKEKDDLLQTVNRLQVEAEVLSCKKTECEELQLQINNLLQKNDEVMASLHQKDELLKDLEVRMGQTTVQNAEVAATIQSSSEEIQRLQEMCKSEQVRALTLQQESKNQAQLNAELKQKLEEMTEKLQESLKHREQLDHDLNITQKQLDNVKHNKQTLEAESKKCHNEMLSLNEEKDILSKDLARLRCEHSGCLSSREELDHLKIKFQLLAEDKEQVTKFLESEQHQLEAVKSQLIVLKETLSIDDTEQDIIHMLQSINEAMSHINSEKQNVISQRDEKSVQLERLQEESESQCAELRALLSEYSKEKVILKSELEESLADKAALQKNLEEMKGAFEKAKLENQELLSHVEKVTADLENLEKQMKVEMLEKENLERQEGLKSMMENKEAEIGALTLELASLKDVLSKSKALEVEQQTQITELQIKIGNLEKDCKEKEEKCNKIKAVAVKAKKELDFNKKEAQATKEMLDQIRIERDQLSSSMKDLVQSAESYQNLLREYDRQTELLETERERANSSELQVVELSKQLHSATLEQEKLNHANEDFVARMETLQSNNKLLEAQILEMQRAKLAVDKELEAGKLLIEQKIKDHNGALKQLEDLQAQLQKEKKQLQKTMQELELVRKDAQKSTLMDMEIADYERLVKELNLKLTSKCSQLEDMEQEIHIHKQKQETLQGEISSLQATVEQHEERSMKIKQLLVKTKKELADSKQAESDQLILQASLKGELEASQQQVETYKIQVAELTSEKHKIQEQLRVLADQQQRAANTYQQKLSALQEECAAAKAEQATVTSEFESYKVRVHNVLKQQKTKSASQAEQEVYKQERDHLQTTLDQLKVKLQETQHNLQISTMELQTLQSEHDTLLERHNKLLQEMVVKEAELREKLCAVQSENTVLKAEHTQLVSQLSAQNEALRNSFREQVRHLQEDHRKTVETLQQQLSKVEAQLFQVKSETTAPNTTGFQQPLKGLRERRPTDLPLLDLYSVAREDGEGMEMTDTESVSSASTHIASFEQLLSSSEAKLEPPQWQPELSKEELVQKLSTTSKSVDHLNGLLHETEATNAMLMEQITLLKNEIRRLERNQEREKSVANLEYLKNVLLQFIFLKAGSERQRLLPVIDTMLQLSPEEKGKLHAIAQGDDDNAARPAGWTSYLHSWSGLR